MARSINTNVSTSAVTRAERVIISELLVNVKEADACKKSFVWQYFGPLHRRAADGLTDMIDNDRVHCRYHHSPISHSLYSLSVTCNNNYSTKLLTDL